VYGFVAEQADLYPIIWMCRILDINRSGYYRWASHQQRPPTPRQRQTAQIRELIRTLFAASHGRPGRRPMHQLLRNQGCRCSLGLVHRLMAEQQLVARRHRRFRGTTRPDPAARTKHIPNHLTTATGARCFASTTPGTRLVSDITYLPTRDGWAYLAIVLDLANRAVVGWAVRSRCDTELVRAALAMARAQGAVRTDAIIHSDRGSQYTAIPFQQFCQTHRIRQSLGATGVCWDNAVAESFFAILKGDRRDEPIFPNLTAARHWLFPYIEVWYNRQRPHGTNMGHPPLAAAFSSNPPPLPVSFS